MKTAAPANTPAHAICAPPCPAKGLLLHALVFLLFSMLCVLTANAWAATLSLENHQDILGMKTDVPDAPVARQPRLPASAIGDKAGEGMTPPVEEEEVEEPEAAPDAAPDAAPAEAQAAQAPAAKAKPIHLFGHVEFRGPLKNIPKWERVLKEEKKSPSYGAGDSTGMPEEVRKRWLPMREKLKDKPLMEQLKAVNNFFNQWPYKTDIANWGPEDYWATPKEFFKKSGDCEDYAIAKYYALRDLGVPASQMRIVAVMETIRGIGHAVLVVFVDDKAYVLDSLSNLLLQHSRLTNYEPKFSVNEEFRWVHVKPVKQSKKK